MRLARIHPAVSLAALFLGLMTLTPPASAVSNDGTVVVRVLYRDSSGVRHPLAGVQVYLWDGVQARLACTNAKGKAKFGDVYTDVDLYAATGPVIFGEAGATGPVIFGGAAGQAVFHTDADCDNPEFLRPEDGRKMWLVQYDGHHGVSLFDSFQVGTGETVKITLGTKTPTRQWKVCSGLLTTIRGTGGDDVIPGTAGTDVIHGRNGNDTIAAGPGPDVVCGGKGRDSLAGNGGSDLLLGENGRDRLAGGAGVDAGNGGPGIDRCKGVEQPFSFDQANDPCEVIDEDG